MNEGIDTGDILFVKEYELNPKDLTLSEFSNEEVYRGILTYYDPGLRIKSLIELLEKASIEQGADLRMEELNFSKQNPSEGRTFFFMHEHFRNLVINKLKRSETVS